MHQIIIYSSQFQRYESVSGECEAEISTGAEIWLENSLCWQREINEVGCSAVLHRCSSGVDPFPLHLKLIFLPTEEAICSHTFSLGTINSLRTPRWSIKRNMKPSSVSWCECRFYCYFIILELDVLLWVRLLFHTRRTIHQSKPERK